MHIGCERSAARDMSRSPLLTIEHRSGKTPPFLTPPLRPSTLVEHLLRSICGTAFQENLST